MPVYAAPLDDIRFALYELLNAEALTELPGYEEASRDLVDPVLDEGARICEEVLFPINLSGDQEGCHFNEGEVTTPKGFKEAYQTFAEGGWCGLSADPDYGGMGLPVLINTVMQEMICSANFSFGMYPGLSQGAYEALHLFGSDEQKETYLPRLASGEWSGTMCLTEPHCGTDLGLIKTKAEPLTVMPAEAGIQNQQYLDPRLHGDDNAGEVQAYQITGTKIFISAGEHDLTENIVHLVLAKLPDAPEGVKGISLFVVPKFMPDDMSRNGVKCGSIEHKMGIKASSTAVLNFENATGWLVGEPHKGLRAMFTMMNAARLGVAMQGLGIAEVSYQNALSYAKERLQMRALDGAKAPDKPADPIIVHPDVRRMLLTMKAFTEGARALSYWTAMNLDISEKHEDETARKNADDLVALMTPILKAYLTDMGTASANLAIQVYGGHGYIAEYGVEQYARDARIAEIYEGTNGIQALDLVGRKMGQGYGRLLRQFFHPCSKFIEEEMGNAEMQEFVMPLAKAFAKLQQSSAFIAQKGLKDPNEAGAASTDYLRQFALVALAYMWCRMVKISLPKQDEDFYAAKIMTARFFMTRMLPEAESRFRMVMAGAAPLMAEAL